MLNNNNSETTQMLVFVSGQEPTSEVIFRDLYAIMPQRETFPKSVPTQMSDTIFAKHSLSHHRSLGRSRDKCHVTGLRDKIETHIIMCQIIAKLHVFFVYIFFAKNS